jgi:L,D-transpeptidase YcbB
MLPILLPAQKPGDTAFVHSLIDHETGRLKMPAAVKLFYAERRYQMVWMIPKQSTACKQLLQALAGAEVLALNREAYHAPLVNQLLQHTTPLQNYQDSLLADVQLTDAALHFYYDLLHGNRRPVLGYEGLKYPAYCFDVVKMLQQRLQNVWPPLPGINETDGFTETAALLLHFNRLRQMIAQPGFSDGAVTSLQAKTTNKPLMNRLYQLGITDAAYKPMADSVLKERIKDAQVLFNLPADGKPSNALLRQINVPLRQRMEQLRISINYWRWLFCMTQQQPVILVNLPAAMLSVYDKGSLLLHMKLVVGKPSTPTPTLSSQVREVVVYPYWHVPASIVANELLPAIKRNKGYLAANNYQVIKGNGQVIDPASINFHVYSRYNFPYIIRQATGCDNALGILKLEFYNPFSVYLHDTPSKSLFKKQYRFFSHGCMRMEEPIAMGRLLLGDNAIAIDTLYAKGCLPRQEPLHIPVTRKVGVVVWYNTVSAEAGGRVVFYEDIYRKNIR